MSQISRRKFITIASASAASTILINACSPPPPPTTTQSPSPATGGSPTQTPAVNIAPGEAPEVTTATLGFIALTDSAPLIIALEKGLFAKHGMADVKVVKQASWPVTRDNLELGSPGGGIDGAHILSPMPYLMSLGTITKGNQPVPMYILARLNTNGQAISLSNDYLPLKLTVKDAAKFKEAVLQAKSGGKEVKAAVTFPGGTHDLWMRYWLASGGMLPDQDISVVPVPPPQMVANMKVGNMETFCVGEPWNAQLVAQKQGYTALITGELWKDHPEKCLSMRADWVDKNPKAAQAILKAVMEAQKWCDDPANIAEMCQIVAQDKWFKVPVEDILGRSQGNIDFGTGQVITNSPLSMKFWRDYASYPFKSHDTWFLVEDMRWGYLPQTTDLKIVDKVNREDLWRQAAKSLNLPANEIPASPSRGVETFFDGVTFNPDDPMAYLNSLAIKNLK